MKNINTTSEGRKGMATGRKKALITLALLAMGITLFTVLSVNLFATPAEALPCVCGNGVCQSSCGEFFENCPSDCTPAICGNFECEAGEAISCPEDCVGTTCGDGVKGGAEQCDDGNAQSNDGCSDMCTTEAGWLCLGNVAPPPDTQCSPICGDGLLRGSETCDDGNTDDGDGCNSGCTVEPGWTCDGLSPSTCSPICGDNQVLGNEACDGTDLNGQTCDSQGFVGGGILQCNAQCNGFDTTGCFAQDCGNGVIDAGETCDDLGAVSGDGCSATCQTEDFCILDQSEHSFKMWTDYNCPGDTNLGFTVQHNPAVIDCQGHTVTLDYSNILVDGGAGGISLTVKNCNINAASTSAGLPFFISRSFISTATINFVNSTLTGSSATGTAASTTDGGHFNMINSTIRSFGSGVIVSIGSSASIQGSSISVRNSGVLSEGVISTISNSVLTSTSSTQHVIDGSINNIVNNTITGGLHGIFKNPNSYIQLIEGNDISGAASHGMNLIGQVGTVIKDNNAHNNVGSGAYITGSGLTITNNQFNNNGRYGLEGSASGSSTKSGNTMNGNTLGGMLFNAQTCASQPCNDPFSGNTVENNFGPGVTIDGAGGDLTSIDNNIIRNNVGGDIIVRNSNNVQVTNNLLSQDPILICKPAPCLSTNVALSGNVVTGGGGGGPIQCVNTDQLVTLTADDGPVPPMCGVLETRFCQDQTDSCTPSTVGNSVIVSQEGINFVRFHSVDNFNNNAEAIKTIQVAIDKTDPVTVGTFADDNSPLGGCFNITKTAELEATDTPEVCGGVASTVYCVDGPGCIPTIPYTVPFAIDQEGSNFVRFTSTDAAGNIEDTRTAEVKLDFTAPTTTATAVGTLVNGWFITDVSVTLDVTDNDVCGTSQTFFSRDDGPFEIYTGAILFSVHDPGEHTVDFFSIDAAGNVEATQQIIIRIDNIPPTTTKQIIDQDGDTVEDAIILTCTDNESGCEAIFWKFDNGVTQTFDCVGTPQTCDSGTIPLPARQGHTLEFWSIDIGQNEEVHQTQVHDGDACPGVQGKAQYQGCPVADKITFTNHTIDMRAGKPACGGAGSCKTFTQDVEVKVFDRNNADFRTLVGQLEPSNPDRKNPNGSSYDDIFEADELGGTVGKVGECITDATGVCYAGENGVGDYLVIAKFVDNTVSPIRTVYAGLPKSPSDFIDTDGNSIPDLASKELNVVRVFSKTGAVSYRGGSKTVLAGSMLEIIHPVTVIWENSEELYPFIMTSDSAWTVDVCMQVPEGYSVAGVLDDNGNIITNGATDCTQAFVAGETKVILFNIMRTSSPEPFFTAEFTATPSGEPTQKVDIQMTGYKHETNAAQEQVAERVLAQIRAEAEAERRSAEAAAARPVLPAVQVPGAPSSALPAILVLVALVIIAYSLRERGRHKKFGRHI